MPITLITTVGGSTSDSYNSVTEFDAFLVRRRGSTTVDGLTDDEKAQGLLEAMDLLEVENWRGQRVTSTQALSHPRYELPKRDSLGVEGGFGEYSGFGLAGAAYYESTEIAEPVKKAQCELAFLILNSQYSTDDALKAPVTSISMDNLKKDYGAGGQTAAQKGELPPTVARLLSGLIRGNRLVRA